LTATLPYSPIHFGPSGPDERALFGWYHPAAAERGSRECSVLLCNPIGDDFVRAHRALRHLAERLAEAGFPVLRFDFHGTGDSSGTEKDPKRVQAWLDDVDLAVAELRARSGSAKVAVVGLRLGGTVAAWARRENPIDDLVLWNPFVSGSAYVKETTKLHHMHKLLEPQSFAAEPAGWNGGGQEALGFLLTPETVADLAAVDLAALRTRAAEHTLVLGAGSAAADEKLVEHLRTLGGTVEYRNMPGHNFLVQINHRADLPTPIFDEIERWLSERHPAEESASSPAAATSSDGAMRQAGGGASAYGEEPIVFGRSHPLFGILVHPPKEKRDTRRPVIIMTNAGCVHRIGPHRFYVPMARRWAALGFSVFRIDLSGIGDSPVAPGCEENLTYPRDGLADIEDAMTAAAAATGASRFVIVGLCSGGDLAFQMGFKDPRVAGAVMMNPRTFCVHDLDMVDSYKRARYYQDSLFRMTSWKKALRGEVDVRRALGMVVPKVADLLKRRLARVVPARARSSSAAAPKHNDVPACLRSMAERGVDTFIVASENDPGVDYVDVHFGKAMESLRSVRGFRREDFMGIDHTFTSLYAQEKVSQVLTDHFAAMI
jgi:alpha-beta hydrolase superfamily lysophospholipase